MQIKVSSEGSVTFVAVCEADGTQVSCDEVPAGQIAKITLANESDASGISVEVGAESAAPADEEAKTPAEGEGCGETPASEPDEAAAASAEGGESGGE